MNIKLFNARINVTFVSLSLISIHTLRFSVHLGVFPREDSLKHPVTDEDVEIKRWLWGHAVEPYDRCLDYYGFGPFFYVVVPR